MRYLIILLCSMIHPVHAELDLYAGLSVNDVQSADPEVSLPNPIGIVRLEYKSPEVTVFCEHLSSLLYYEEGSGLNHCGMLIPLKWKQ